MSRTMLALAFGFLLVAGWTYAGEPPFRETARVTLHEWRVPAELVGDDDVAITTQIWISQDGNVGLGSSWSTGETPAEWGATDGILVDGVASQVSMTSGLDQNAITVGRLDVTDNFTGDLGLPGTPLRFASVNPITMRGSGTLHYRATGASTIFVNSPNHLNAVSLVSCNILGLYVVEGHVDVGAGSVFSNGGGILTTFGPYATVTVAGSGETGPIYIQVHDGTVDTGLRGLDAVAPQPLIEVAGGLLRLHRLTGDTNHSWIRQTGGVLDFDIAAGNGVGVRMQLAGGIADFRKCQYAFSSLLGLSYIGPGMQIIPGPVTTEAVLTASGIYDFRKEYP